MLQGFYFIFVAKKAKGSDNSFVFAVMDNFYEKQTIATDYVSRHSKKVIRVP